MLSEAVPIWTVLFFFSRLNTQLSFSIIPEIPLTLHGLMLIFPVSFSFSVYLLIWMTNFSSSFLRKGVWEVNVLRTIMYEILYSI